MRELSVQKRLQIEAELRKKLYDLPIQMPHWQAAALQLTINATASGYTWIKVHFRLPEEDFREVFLPAMKELGFKFRQYHPGKYPEFAHWYKTFTE